MTTLIIFNRKTPYEKLTVLCEKEWGQVTPKQRQLLVPPQGVIIDKSFVSN